MIRKLRSGEYRLYSRKVNPRTGKRRKGTPLQSAMSMLNFYINRGGRSLSPARSQTAAVMASSGTTAS